jgi:hypothetical protein
LENFSIVNVFSQYDLKNYWFETGTPSFLVSLIKEKDYPIPNIENMEIAESVFSTYDLENLQLEALLFQTGYVTIYDAEVQPNGGSRHQTNTRQGLS